MNRRIGISIYESILELAVLQITGLHQALEVTNNQGCSRLVHILECSIVRSIGHSV